MIMKLPVETLAWQSLHRPFRPLARRGQSGGNALLTRRSALGGCEWQLSCTAEANYRPGTGQSSLSGDAPYIPSGILRMALFNSVFAVYVGFAPNNY